KKFKKVTRVLILHLASHGLMAQVLVTGQVVDQESGIAIPGVNISIAGAVPGTVSSHNGEFSVTVQDSATVLTFSSVGYLTEKKSSGQYPMTVSLQPSL